MKANREKFQIAAAAEKTEGREGEGRGGKGRGKTLLFALSDNVNNSVPGSVSLLMPKQRWW